MRTRVQCLGLGFGLGSALGRRAYSGPMPGRSDGTDDGHSGMGGADGRSSRGGEGEAWRESLRWEFLVAYEKRVGGVGLSWG